jgi:nitrate reductase cytochrome c-type subunit
VRLLPTWSGTPDQLDRDCFQDAADSAAATLRNAGTAYRVSHFMERLEKLLCNIKERPFGSGRFSEVPQADLKNCANNTFI